MYKHGSQGQALLSISAYIDGGCACFIYYLKALKSKRRFFSAYRNPFVPVIHRTKCIEVCFPLLFPILLHSLNGQTHLHIPYIHIIQARSLLGSSLSSQITNPTSLIISFSRHRTMNTE